ncbi:hypothetical protein EDD15DRAFT_2515498 [Pisolithus albus]|nr:hypothetical protein EDD15DRAFT_2515498 [Pisolithus albus]
MIVTRYETDSRTLHRSRRYQHISHLNEGHPGGPRVGQTNGTLPVHGLYAFTRIPRAANAGSPLTAVPPQTTSKISMVSQIWAVKLSWFARGRVVDVKLPDTTTTATSVSATSSTTGWLDTQTNVSYAGEDELCDRHGGVGRVTVMKSEGAERGGLSRMMGYSLSSTAVRFIANVLPPIHRGGTPGLRAPIDHDPLRFCELGKTKRVVVGVFGEAGRWQGRSCQGDRGISVTGRVLVMRCRGYGSGNRHHPKTMKEGVLGQFFRPSSDIVDRRLGGDEGENSSPGYARRNMNSEGCNPNQPVQNMRDRVLTTTLEVSPDRLMSERIMDDRSSSFVHRARRQRKSALRHTVILHSVTPWTNMETDWAQVFV